MTATAPAPPQLSLAEREALSLALDPAQIESEKAALREEAQATVDAEMGEELALEFPAAESRLDAALTRLTASMNEHCDAREEYDTAHEAAKSLARRAIKLDVPGPAIRGWIELGATQLLHRFQQTVRSGIR